MNSLYLNFLISVGVASFTVVTLYYLVEAWKKYRLDRSNKKMMISLIKMDGNYKVYQILPGFDRVFPGVPESEVLVISQFGVFFIKRILPTHDSYVRVAYFDKIPDPGSFIRDLARFPSNRVAQWVSLKRELVIGYQEIEDFIGRVNPYLRQVILDPVKRR